MVNAYFDTMEVTSTNHSLASRKRRKFNRQLEVGCNKVTKSRKQSTPNTIRLPSVKSSVIIFVGFMANTRNRFKEVTRSPTPSHGCQPK